MADPEGGGSDSGLGAPAPHETPTTGAPTPPSGSTGGAPTPPQGFAGAASTAPRGFAGAGPSPATVPVPPARPPSSPSKSKRGLSTTAIIVIVLAVGGIVGWLITMGGSDSTTKAGTGTSSNTNGDPQETVEVKPGTPEAAVVDWWAAMAKRDYAGACKLLAQPSIDRLKLRSPTCEAELERINPNGLYDKGDDTVVLGVLVEDQFARVLVRTGASDFPEKKVIAARENGAWKAMPFDNPHPFRDELDADGRVITHELDPTSPEGKVVAACKREREQVEHALRDYLTGEGVAAPDLQALVTKEYLIKLPPHSLLGEDGAVEMVGDCV